MQNLKVPKKCPKCGYDDINILYIAECSTLSCEEEEKFYNSKFVENAGTIYKFKKECLKLHCRTCHYEWLTETLSEVKR